MIYFNSRYLSEKLNVNLAKWKRWSREFLPPDPLGGLQSGYARQFNHREAFKIYLGGILVSMLRFSIPETRKILQHLDQTLEKQGVYTLNPKSSPSSARDRWLLIYIMPEGRIECEIGTETNINFNSNAHFGRMLNLSGVYNYFLDKLDD